MSAYRLFVESGPQKRKTMVHVPELLGCVAVGATTDEAIARTTDAIRAYRGFLRRHGEDVAEIEPIETAVVEHITKGDFIGNGSPYIVFEGDLEPVSAGEIDCYGRRFIGLVEELAAWAASRTPAELDAEPPTGRTSRQILLHVISSASSYLGPSVGNPPGSSALAARAERGELSLDEALRRFAEAITTRLDATTPAERALVRDNPKGARSLRKSIRRLLEHTWEHLAELSRREGGPAL